MPEYVCTCGPNEYCAADDCHGARGETPPTAIRRWWERRVRASGCSECFDWFDWRVSLNRNPVTPEAPLCPIRGERCVRYCGLGRVVTVRCSAGSTVWRWLFVAPFLLALLVATGMTLGLLIAWVIALV